MIRNPGEIHDENKKMTIAPIRFRASHRHLMSRLIRPSSTVRIRVLAGTS